MLIEISRPQDPRAVSFERRANAIDQLCTSIDARMAHLERALVDEFRSQFEAQRRLLLFSMAGAVVTATTLAFAAARF